MTPKENTFRNITFPAKSEVSWEVENNWPLKDFRISNFQGKEENPRLFCPQFSQENNCQMISWWPKANNWFWRKMSLYTEKKLSAKKNLRWIDVSVFPCRKQKRGLVVIAKLIPSRVSKIETLLKEPWQVVWKEIASDIHNTKK